jgi:hypothetical protein
MCSTNCLFVPRSHYFTTLTVNNAKRVESVSHRMSYKTLKGRWCDIIVLNVHAPTEDKDDVIQNSFYEELEG